MEKKNIVVSTLAEMSNDVYAKLKRDLVSDIKSLQEMFALSDNEMCLILGISDKDFWALMDDRLYYVIKIDTMIRVKLMLNRYAITLKKPDKGDIDFVEFVRRFKSEEIDNSVNNLLDVLGLKTAEEINYFTDFLLQTINKKKPKNEIHL